MEYYEEEEVQRQVILVLFDLEKSLAKKKIKKKSYEMLANISRLIVEEVKVSHL